MSNPIILTIDFGTQSVRVGLFDKKGNVLAIEKEKYNPPYFSNKPGYAEQNPNCFFETMCKCGQRIKEKNPDLLKDIIGVSLTCFRDSAVLLDKNLNVIRPCILWLDQRDVDVKEKLPISSRLAFKLVGMTDTIILNQKRTMSHWIKQNEPENWAKMYKYVAISTYFNYLLTGELKDSPSNQAGHYPIDFKNREWYKSDKNLKGQIFGVKRVYLCDLVPVGGTIGYISKEASEKTGIPEGLPLFSCGSDKSCETLGVGALDENVASISYGTASTVEVSVKKYHDSEKFLPSYPACIPDYYNMDVQIYRGYWMLNWFAKEFAQDDTVESAIEKNVVLDKLNERLMEIPAGSDGLVLQPYWGPGLRRPLAKGAIIGFSDIHTREHLYRAIIEGIGYALREALEGFQKTLHHKIDYLMISGGGSQSDAICQITADLFGLPVSRVQTFETSSLGAGISGFLAAKEFSSPDKAVQAMVHKTDLFKPNMDTHKQYDYLFYNAYLKMYPNLKDIYKNIKAYGKKKF
jgi:sugar (pentulose or hexulose) kinase